MYNVSSEYLKAVRALSRTDRITGTITFSDGEEASLTDRKVGPGGLSIKRGCVSGEELEFGGAILSDLTCSLRTQRPRNVFYGAVIRPVYGIRLPDGSWYDIPLGKFTVAEAERSGQIVSITAYDDLTKLDKRYYGQILTGTAFQILSKISGFCDIPLGMTEEELAVFPNGSETLRIDSTSGCSTYRDCVKQVAIALAAFAAVDVSGALILKSFSKTSDVTLGKRHRYSITPADYVCWYDRLTIESSNGTICSTVPDGELSALGTGILGEFVLGFGEDDTDGLEMVIPDAACWNTGTPEVQQARCEALLDELMGLSYTPATWTMPGDPALEPGDRVAHVTDEGDFESLITSITWSFRGKMRVESVGRNPHLMTQQTIGMELPLKDYNGDGKIDLADADYFFELVANNDPSLTLEDDWNGDGQVTSTDVRMYRQLVVEYLGSVPNTSNAVAGEVVVAQDVEDGIVKETATVPIPYNYRGDCADANTAYLSGSYRLIGSTANCPVTDGTLLVFGDGNASGPIVQVAISSDGQQRKMRTLWYGTAYAWTDF